MGKQSGHWMNEPDIGSGEKTAAQRELEQEQHALGQERAAAMETNAPDENDTRTLQSGDHLARVATRPLDDGTYEAQVYVRLTREPEIAETYIPAGSFSTEHEARAAAEERARRALEEREF